MAYERLLRKRGRFWLSLIDEAFDSPSWHGPALRRSLRGITAAQAAWRPRPGAHNIWELAVHAAYWKHEVRRRLKGARIERFTSRGRNWFRRPEPGRSRAWKADLRLLQEEHRLLRAVIASLSTSALRRRVAGGHTTAFTVRGIAAHDLYHAGQIQLLRRLQR